MTTKPTIGLFTDGLRSLPFGSLLDWCAEHGVETLEFGTGNFSPAPHCDLAGLLSSDAARDEWLGAIHGHGLAVSALNCSGNVLDPARERRETSVRVLHDTFRLALALGIDTVVVMSGCPGEPGSETRYPNWVTHYWQPEYQTLLDEQWRKVVEPFWRATAPVAADHGVRLAFEMHPGQAVYNPRTFLRLREIGGEAVGLNLDPSHLFWQGIEPLRVIDSLGDVIWHVHAKDCLVDADELSLNGCLETRTSGTRAWRHCGPGLGHSEAYWHEFVSALVGRGFDRTFSIEYAGPRTEVLDGIASTVGLLSTIRDSLCVTAGW